MRGGEKMFGKRIRVFKIFGFEVGINWSWIILAILIAWSLSVGLFPVRFKGLSTQTYWLMGIIGALGLFFSIVFHEMSHSLIARKYGIKIKGITLFIFGGVADMGDEPRSPKAEFMMALSLMSKSGLSRLMVTEGNRLVGVIVLKDMLKFLSLKVELEEI